MADNTITEIAYADDDKAVSAIRELMSALPDADTTQLMNLYEKTEKDAGRPHTLSLEAQRRLREETGKGGKRADAGRKRLNSHPDPIGVITDAMAEEGLHALTNDRHDSLARWRGGYWQEYPSESDFADEVRDYVAAHPELGVTSTDTILRGAYRRMCGRLGNYYHRELGEPNPDGLLLNNTALFWKDGRYDTRPANQDDWFRARLPYDWPTDSWFLERLNAGDFERSDLNTPQVANSFINDCASGDEEYAAYLWHTLARIVFWRPGKEEILLFVGRRGTGKSTFMLLAQSLLSGHLSANIQQDAFDARFGLSPLRFRPRLICVDDASPRKFPANMLKRLTGNPGEIRVRIEQKHKDDYEVAVNAHILLTANEMPPIYDHAFRRRIMVLPFRKSAVDAGVEDTDLGKRLREERPQIIQYLAMVLESGHGANPPAWLREYSDDKLFERDTFAEWWRSQLEATENWREGMTAQELYSHYRSWVEDETSAIGDRAFRGKLEGYGIVSIGKRRRSKVYSVRLRSETTEAEMPLNGVETELCVGCSNHAAVHVGFCETCKADVVTGGVEDSPRVFEELREELKRVKAGDLRPEQARLNGFDKPLFRPVRWTTGFGFDSDGPEDAEVVVADCGLCQRALTEATLDPVAGLDYPQCKDRVRCDAVVLGRERGRLAVNIEAD